MNIRSLFSHYWKSFIFIGCILYLSFTNPSTFKGIPTFENEDKLVHFLLYFGLTCLLIFDFRQGKKNTRMSTLTCFLVCILFPIFLGGAVEILQPMYFAPRTAEWLDWFSDIGGVLLGWITMFFLKEKLDLIFK